MDHGEWRTPQAPAEARKAEAPGYDIPYGSFPDGEDLADIWTPPSPSLTVEADLTNIDIAEVSVHRSKDRSLAAVIALVTQGNKNTPRRRTAFLSRMVSYLQQQAGVLVVDVVRKPRENLHGALMQFLDAGSAASGVLTSDLYSAAYRGAGKFQSARLEVWPAPLAIGKPLPVMPLWLEEYLAVPVDLEAAYVEACVGNRLL